MSGRKERDQVEPFVAESLGDLPPEGHAAVRVDGVSTRVGFALKWPGCTARTTGGRGPTRKRPSG